MCLYVCAHMCVCFLNTTVWFQEAWENMGGSNVICVFINPLGDRGGGS